MRSVSGNEGGRTDAQDRRVGGERDGAGRDCKRVKREVQGRIVRRGKTRPSRTSVRRLHPFLCRCLLLTLHSCPTPGVSHADAHLLPRYFSIRPYQCSRTRVLILSNDSKQRSRPSPRTTSGRHSFHDCTTLQTTDLRTRRRSRPSPNRGESQPVPIALGTNLYDQINSRATSPRKSRSPSKTGPPPPPLAPPPPPYLAAPLRIPTPSVKVKRVSHLYSTLITR